MGEIKKLADIVVEARAKGRKKMAVAYGQDSHTLEAVYAAYKEGLVDPILYGDKEVIEQVCAEHGIDVSVFTIVDEKVDVKCVAQAVQAVASGEADVLMKGLVTTEKYMRGILNKEAGLFPPKAVLSHVSVIEMPVYPKLFAVRTGSSRTLPVKEENGLARKGHRLSIGQTVSFSTKRAYRRVKLLT